jgi:hypothetical protein
VWAATVCLNSSTVGSRTRPAGCTPRGRPDPCLQVYAPGPQLGRPLKGPGANYSSPSRPLIFRRGRCVRCHDRDSEVEHSGKRG